MTKLKLSKFCKRPDYKGRKYIKSLEKAQQEIKNVILAGKPALIARFGWTKATSTINFVGYKIGAIPIIIVKLSGWGLFIPTLLLFCKFLD